MTTPDSPSSRIPGFYRLSVEERLAFIAQHASLDPAEVAALRGPAGALLEASRMVENVAGTLHLPVGFAANFRIDGVDRLLPLVIEESSVIAAASHAAKLLRGGPGIVTEASDPLMIGQIQLSRVLDPTAAIVQLKQAEAELIELANATDPELVAAGGGARQVIARHIPRTEAGPILVVHLIVDVRDAMGANLVNQMVERLAPECERVTGGVAGLRIVSNLADRRLVHAQGRVPLAALERPDLGLDGKAVALRVSSASIFAEVDPYRAATHNKGIMNGVDAFMLATGQDWRAVEAGAHAFAARGEDYTALATWRRHRDELVGKLSLPMQVGVVGGMTRSHPVVKVLLKVVGANGATDIARVAAAVGLAQNLAALLALTTEGIQRGHMSLHARNIAAAVGAHGPEIDRVVAEMIRQRTISHSAAQSILQENREAPPSGVPVPDADALKREHWPAIERAIAEVVPRGGPSGSLSDMLWYQLDSGGKRLRAVIPLAVGSALGLDPSRLSTFAAAMELLHNATLVHDEAEQRRGISRRGRRTVWARYGLAQAINAGDGMLYAALKCLHGVDSRAPESRQHLTSRVVDHMLTIVNAQIDGRRLAATAGALPDDWLTIAEDRVGGLFRLALVGAATLADADASVLERLQAVGGHLGVIFLVQDELLDLLGTTPQSRGQAIAEGGLELVLSRYLQHAPPADADEVSHIVAQPAAETTPEHITRCMELLEASGALQFALDTALTRRTAVEAVATELGGPLGELLANLVEVLLRPLVRRVGDLSG